VSNHKVVVNLSEDVLSVVAQLKSSQISQTINGLTGQVAVVSSRQFMQNLLVNYYFNNGTGTDDMDEFRTAVESIDDVIAGTIYSYDLKQVVWVRANSTSTHTKNVTIPDMLYPVKYSNLSQITADTRNVEGYLVGPKRVEESTYLMSLTRQLTENNPELLKIKDDNLTDNNDYDMETVGFMTVILDARAVYNVIHDPEYDLISVLELGWQGVNSSLTTAVNRETGHEIEVPAQIPQRWDMMFEDNVYAYDLFDSTLECYLCENAGPTPVPGYIREMLVNGTSGAEVDGDFSNHLYISAGYAPANTLNRHWGVIAAQPHSKALSPLTLLSQTLLISVFVIGFVMCVGTMLLSSWAVKPVTRLQAATEKSTAFLGGSPRTPVRVWYKPWVKKPDLRKRKNVPKNGEQQEHAANAQDSFEQSTMEESNGEKKIMEGPQTQKEYNGSTDSSDTHNQQQQSRQPKSSPGKRGWRNWRWWLFFTKKRQSETAANEASGEEESEGFKIPDRVVTRKWIKDELTDLTETFNGMTDELRRQYAFLEERVAQRTKEIERARIVAESANEAKSLFIANITHELRTPLNGILGMTSVSMEERDPQKLRESLQIIFKSGELLLHLLTDLLSFSKNNVGNMELEEKEFMVPEVMTQLNAIFAEQSKRNKIDLSVVLATPELQDHVVYGDVNRILQIVINLVSNSLKFTPKGGSVKVHITGVRQQPQVEEIDPEKQDQGETEEPEKEEKTKSAPTSPGEEVPLEYDGVMGLTFEVQDTGPGIAPHLQKRVFEPFVQGDLPFSERRGGAGLGLSICRQLAGLMHGSVDLESELGKGSLFTFKVPLNIVKNSTYLQKTHTQLEDMSKFDQWPEYENFETLERQMSQISTTTSTYNNTNTTAAGDKSEPVSSSQRRSGSSEPDNESKSSTTSPKQRPPISRNPSSRGEDDKKINFPVKVLIVEDNKVNQEVMIRMLKLEGLEDVKVANDGLEAVSQVRETVISGQNMFDIIFMDVQMPNLDGRQATQIIRSELEFDAPIVAVSAFANPSNVDDCIAAGMDKFLAKPLRRPQLHKILLEVLTHDTNS
jgi:signal transduction histidine kinase/CheY-like chemotaxis protein